MKVKAGNTISRLMLILIFFTNISFAQTDQKFLTDFLQGDQLEANNSLSQYNDYDFKELWTKSENQLIYGIIGAEHQRIKIKLISIKKSPSNPNEYFVYGKSSVKQTICDFKGTIQLKEIRKVKDLHFGVDNQYADKGIKAQGILVASYKFKENIEQNHSGIFEGQLYSKWYLDSKSMIHYDDIQLMSDGYMNNAFIGVWKSYKTGKEKICNWGDYRVPKANQDFDIGVGEFTVSEKYWDKGWFDIALENQVPNEAVTRKKASAKSKEWWE
ncbi:MAG TPA: hypothetical protein VD908_01195 [Cytophagales bacterium]|nr:hypothetical protein [Cytophagales bacterium]